MDELYRQLKHIKKDSALNLKISKDKCVRAHHDKLFIVNSEIKPSTYNLNWYGEDELHLPNNTKLQFIKKNSGGLSLLKLGVKSLKIKSRTGGEKLKPFSDQPSRSLKYLFQNADIPLLGKGSDSIDICKKTTRCCS